ncbi:uncharacterized protein LOC119667626 [Teleopsis dalmanni]|uniref:uncharacterized protein LOC119667626 n=1 Tax=Teleopsis dalmanni TaxID=139649 RepID=UPI0018CC80D5|nr:uncharacterized protein LOC119667626 [Teleopsis dalmanni]
MLGFCLSKDEISMLIGATTARVKNIGVEIHHKTAVLTFETQSSNTNVGNNNIGVYLCHLAEDIGLKCFGQTAENNSIVENIFWGKHGSRLESTEWRDELGSEYITKNYDHRFQYYSNTTPSAMIIHQLIYIIITSLMLMLLLLIVSM